MNYNNKNTQNKYLIHFLISTSKSEQNTLKNNK